MLNRRLLHFLGFIVLCLAVPAPMLAQNAIERHARIRAAIDRGDFASAIPELQSIRRTEPRVFELNNYDYLLARLSDRLSNPTAATVHYQRVVARNSVLSQYALWHLAERARATGNLTLEREKLRQLMTLAPASVLRDAAVARLGRSFFESKDYASTIQTLRPAASATGNAAERQALALIGQAQLLSGQTDAARQVFNSLVTQLPKAAEPDDLALAGVRGLDLIESGSEENARQSAPQLSEEDHMRRAQIYNFNRDFAGARRHYLAIVERYDKSPRIPEALYMTGRGYYQDRNFVEALTYFQKVFDQFAESGYSKDALSFGATSFARLGRVDDAVATYKKYIDRHGGAPNPERPFLNIVDVLRDAGRDADALSWVEQARTRFKGDTGATLALFSRARIHLSRKDWQAALADFETLRGESKLGNAQTPGSTSQTEIAFTRAFVLEQLGRIDDAIKAYMELPDGRNEYYGGRATQRLRQLAADPKTQASIRTLADRLRATAETALSSKQFDEARLAARSALRLTDDSVVRQELLDLLRRAYEALPSYNNIPQPRLLPFGRQQVLVTDAANPNNSPTPKALADELLFLGLYDEGVPEFSAAKAVQKAGSDQTSAQPTLSSDEAYTFAVISRRGDYADQAVRYAEPIWKKIPADYMLELAPREMVELLYPIPYREAILENAPQRGVDPRFILAIMRQESRFRANAKSNAAARGLLQFISWTADRIAGELNLNDFQQDDLYEPRTAVMFGSQYMGNLFREFPDMHQAVAASYNGGEDNVARWVARARSKEPDRYVLEIGFAQSKDYVYKVLPNFWVYQRLYDNQLSRR